MNKVNKQKSNTLNFHKILRRLLFLLPIGVIGNILFSYFSTDRNIFEYLKKFQLKYLVLALICTMIPWFTHTIRMLIWTRFLRKKIPFWELYKVSIGTTLGAGISPTAVGGAPVKAGMLMQLGVKPASSVTLALFGTVEDAIFFITAVPIAFILSSSWELPVIRQIISIINASKLFIILPVLLILASLLFFLNSQFNRYLKSIINNTAILSKIKKYIFKVLRDISIVYKLVSRNGKFRFLCSLLVNSVQWICHYSIIYLLLLSFGVHINPMRVFVLQWFVLSLMVVIPTPGASGGAEASFYFIFHHILSSHSIAVLTTVWRIFTFYIQLSVGTIIFLIIDFLKYIDQKMIKKPTSEPIY